jgi:hypothetical protein
MEKEEKVYWLVNSKEDKPYQTTTWYRSVGIEDFVKKVEKNNEIVGVVFSDNNIGFILSPHSALIVN